MVGQKHQSVGKMKLQKRWVKILNLLYHTPDPKPSGSSNDNWVLWGNIKCVTGNLFDNLDGRLLNVFRVHNKGRFYDGF